MAKFDLETSSKVISTFREHYKELITFPKVVEITNNTLITNSNNLLIDYVFNCKLICNVLLSLNSLNSNHLPNNLDKLKTTSESC